MCAFIDTPSPTSPPSHGGRCACSWCNSPWPPGSRRSRSSGCRFSWSLRSAVPSTARSPPPPPEGVWVASNPGRDPGPEPEPPGSLQPRPPAATPPVKLTLCFIWSSWLFGRSIVIVFTFVLFLAKLWSRVLSMLFVFIIFYLNEDWNSKLKPQLQLLRK